MKLKKNLKLSTYNFNNRLNENFKFRNILNIIFKFHLNNAKILFVGTALHFNTKLKTLLKNTNHLIIPEKIWFSGILTNTKSIFRFIFKKYLKKKNILKFLFNLVIKSDLILILNEYLKVPFLKEIFKKQLPIITLNKNIHNFFYSVLTTIFKKAKKFNKK